MRLSICVDAVFGNMTTVDAMKTAKKNGYTDIEFWGWWDKDIEAIDKARKELGISIGALCTRFVSLVDAAKRAEYIKGLEETIPVAKKLGCKTIISQEVKTLRILPKPFSGC